MADKQDEKLAQLFAAARLITPDTATQEAHFESRLLARIERQQSSLALWPIWSWRLMPWFAAIVILVGIGNLLYVPEHSDDLFSPLLSGYEESVTAGLLGGN